MVLAGALGAGAPNPNNPDALEDGYPKRDPGPSSFDESSPDDTNLLTMDPDKAAKRPLDDWKEQDEIYQRSNAQCRANVRRREGDVNVQVVKAKDEDRWEEWTWGSPMPHLNKAATLCRKAGAVLHADPAVPQPLPASSDPEDIDAAEFSSKVLDDILGPANLDDANRQREAFDLACSYASCFRHFRIAAHGRRQALEIEAHPLATTAAQPFAIPQPVLNPFTKQPQVDPATGQPATQLQDAPGPYVLRYVTEAGALTDQRSQAKMEWVPQIVDELLPSTHVRFLPATATFIDKADAVILAGFRSLAELKQMFPDVFTGDPGDPAQGIAPTPGLSDDKIAAMLKYRPERPDDFLPGRGKMERAALEGMKKDNRLVFVLVEYWRACDSYPEGAYLCSAGGEVLLYRGPWSATMQDGTVEPLEIPVSQYLQFREGKQTKDGVAMMQIVGPGNEIRAAQLGATFEYLDRFNSRKTFVPTSSLARPSDLENPSKLYIQINPGGVPVTEQVPEFPREVLEMYDRAGDDMDHASGLEQTAQGLDEGSVNSGIQAQTILGQAHAGMSELREGSIRGSVRGWRIVLQLIRAFYTKPQQLRFEGKDGRMRQRRWSRADLGDTTDVQLKAATMTMMSPAVKIQFVQQLIQLQLIPADEGRDLLTSALAAVSGYKDEPHRLRIRRQLADWEDGPPEGWAPPEPRMMPDPQTGQAVLVPGQDPATAAIWEPTPADQLPPVAQIRLLEIAKCMASTAYLRWPPPWRQPLDAEFMRMQQVVAAAMAPPPAPAAMPGQGAPPQQATP